MLLYRSRQALNTDKQFIFTSDAKISNNFLVAFGLKNAKINFEGNLDEMISKMQAVIAIDCSKATLPIEEYTVNETSIIKNTPIEENKQFQFLDKECIWLGPIKLGEKNNKVYEKITEFNGEKDTYTDENNITYNAAPEKKYTIESNICSLNTDSCNVFSAVSYENGQRKITKYYTDYEFSESKIKLTISKNGIVSLYIKNKNDYDKLGDFKFNYADKNDNYLYILCSGQNLLSNSAVSFVESSETS